MTEKRFQIFGSVVEDTLGIMSITLWQDKKQQEKFCAELNALHEENEQLKSRINDYDVALKKLQDLADKKLKENEQLKIENKHFRKVFGNMYDAYIYGKIGGNVNEL